MATLFVPDNNGNWVDHWYPSVASLAYGRLLTGWQDFRSDVANDTNYNFFTDYITTSNGFGVMTQTESSAWPSSGAATYNSAPWYGDVNTFAHGALHAHLVEEFRTTGNVAPQARIDSPYTIRQ